MLSKTGAQKKSQPKEKRIISMIFKQASEKTKNKSPPPQKKTNKRDGYETEYKWETSVKFQTKLIETSLGTKLELQEKCRNKKPSEQTTALAFRNNYIINLLRLKVISLIVLSSAALWST